VYTDFEHFTVVLYWIEFNFCKLNVDDEAILLLNNLSFVAWTSGKSSHDSQNNLHYIITFQKYFVFCISGLHKQSNRKKYLK